VIRNRKTAEQNGAEFLGVCTKLLSVRRNPRQYIREAWKILVALQHHGKNIVVP
jgi:hypothetical protein